MKSIGIAIGKTVLCIWAAIFVAWFAVHDAFAGTPRGTSAPAQFRKHNACPSTKKFTGACPGWKMDHLEALRCGGRDTPDNLWWQTTEEAHLKDLQESQCWRYYKGPRQ